MGLKLGQSLLNGMLVNTFRAANKELALLVQCELDDIIVTVTESIEL